MNMHCLINLYQKMVVFLLTITETYDSLNNAHMNILPFVLSIMILHESKYKKKIKICVVLTSFGKSFILLTQKLCIVQTSLSFGSYEIILLQVWIKIIILSLNFFFAQLGKLFSSITPFLDFFSWDNYSHQLSFFLIILSLFSL